MHVCHADQFLDTCMRLRFLQEVQPKGQKGLALYSMLSLVIVIMCMMIAAIACIWQGAGSHGLWVRSLREINQLITMGNHLMHHLEAAKMPNNIECSIAVINDQ